MKASKLIERLEEQIKKHGDIKITLEVQKDAWCYEEDDARSVYFKKADKYFIPYDHIVISCHKESK